MAQQFPTPLLAGLFALVPTAAFAAPQTPQPTSNELILNQTTAGNQDDPFVALRPNGFASVWEDNGSTDIVSSLFNKKGVRTVAEFMVDANPGGTELDPGIATASDGAFVITFGGPDADGSGVFFRRYNSSGTPQGGEVAANTTTAGTQDDARVAMRPNGDFAIVWESPDGDSDGIVLRLFAANGTPLTGEISVNTTTAGDQGDPAVAVDKFGRVVVVWDSANQDGSGAGVYARRFDAAGSPLTGEIQVNTFTTGDQDTPRVSSAPGGNFVVVWESRDQDGEDDGIYGQRFRADNSKRGPEFRANTTTVGNQDDPVVGVGVDGTFVVAWESPDGDGDGVFFQRFDLLQSVKRGVETQANVFTSGGQDTPDIALGSAGRMVLVWESTGQDGDADAVIARLYKLGAPNASTGRPILKVKGAKNRTVNKKRFKVRGTAIDNGEITEVQYKKPGKKFRTAKMKGNKKWYIRLKLKPGKNRFIFRAMDDEGKFSKKQKIVINRP